MSVNLENQVVVVVGSSSGIGRAIAVQFAKGGAKVTACARREDRLQQLQRELAGEGKTIQIIAADATKPEDMDRLGQSVLRQNGRVDILVYASGTNTPERSLQRLKPAIWDELIVTNLNGAFYATQAVLPAMREARSGHLIYISSISGLIADVSGAAYQAAKRGLVGFAHAIRVEEKENGIRTCVVCPGLVETEILEKRPVKPPADVLAKALQPEDVADVVLCVAKLNARAAVPEVQVLPTYL